MRGIGDPRAVAVLARLPERGLRGCAILAPKVFHRSSYSDAAGRGGAGRGVGSAQGSDGRSFGRGGAAGRGFPRQEVEEQRERNVYPQEVVSGRFAERRDGSGAVQQQGGAGRGRGIPYAPQQQEAAMEDDSGSSVATERFGRGRGTSIPQPAEAGRGRLIPSPQSAPPPQAWSGIVGRGFPEGRNVDTSEHDIASSVENLPQQRINLGLNGSDQDSNLDPLASSDEPKQSAVEKLLAKLGQSGPQVSPSPQFSPPAEKPKLPFRMPFASPSSAAKQQPVVGPPKPLVQAQTPVPQAPLGRGRGKAGALTQPGIGAEPDVIQPLPGWDDRMPEGAKQDAAPFRRVDRLPQVAMQDPSSSRRVDRIPDRARQEQPRPPSPPRIQLSVEEARARAIAILEQGIEKNVAAEGERRRKAGMEKFADATEFLADKFKRAPGQPSAQPQRSRDERQRQNAVSRRSDRPRRPRRGEEVLALPESAVEVQLTPEQEAELVRIREVDTFKDRLHTLFLTQFEPEFAMEEFGRNPDIDEPPVLSLEEYLQSYKPFFLHEDAELSEEQKWQEAVKTSLANAPNLEKLVEAYAGQGRITAQQQIAKLQTIHQQLSPSVSPEVTAFTQRAFLTLQNNPHLNMQQKQKLMTSIVSGFSSS